VVAIVVMVDRALPADPEGAIMMTWTPVRR